MNLLIDMPDADYSARVAGKGYIGFLSDLHRMLAPKRYLEVGTAKGATLAIAHCASLAVDPKFTLDRDVVGDKPLCLLFQETSDFFFGSRDPCALLGGPVDLAFLDGMHLFEFLLRDLANIERHCRPNSIVALHDCLPPGFYMTARAPDLPAMKKSKFAHAWTGDVWRIIPVLKKYRPDLSITLVDCPPTGIVLVTNLDPNNTILRDQYREITQVFSRVTDERKAFDEFWSTIEITPSVSLQRRDDVARLFWL